MPQAQLTGAEAPDRLETLTLQARAIPENEHIIARTQAPATGNGSAALGCSPPTVIASYCWSTRRKTRSNVCPAGGNCSDRVASLDPRRKPAAGTPCRRGREQPTLDSETSGFALLLQTFRALLPLPASPAQPSSRH